MSVQRCLRLFMTPARERLPISSPAAVIIQPSACAMNHPSPTARATAAVISVADASENQPSMIDSESA
jgi:hypothetical protein